MILASGSPRRIEMLQEVGLDPRVMPSDIDETPLPDETPVAMVARLAKAKAAAQLPQAACGEVIVGADTTVTIDGEVLGKPADNDEAFSMLKRLSGHTHQVTTAVCLLMAGDDGNASATRSFEETTDVTFFDLGDSLIAAYVNTGEPADKAGAYGIQGAGRMLVRGINGDFYNVVGLPIARFMRELDALTGHGVA